MQILKGIFYMVVSFFLIFLFVALNNLIFRVSIS